MGGWVRVEVECSSIRHIAPGIVGNDGDIVAYLALIRIAFERVKCIAHCNVSGPADAAVGAIGVEELRVRVVNSISRVMPDSIEPSIRGYCEGTEPMPLAGINRVVVDLDWRAEGRSVVRAAHEHHVGCASPRRNNAGQHVNVIVGWTTGAINCKE